MRLEARAKDNAPFFLYLAIDDTHTPYHADNPEMFDQDYAGPCDSETRTVPFARHHGYRREEIIDMIAGLP